MDTLQINISRLTKFPDWKCFHNYPSFQDGKVSKFKTFPKRCRIFNWQKTFQVEPNLEIILWNYSLYLLWRDSVLTTRTLVFREYLCETKNLAKPFLPAVEFLIQKISKISWHCSLKEDLSWYNFLFLCCHSWGIISFPRFWNFLLY